MIEVKREPLNFYIERIQNGERTVFPRWGDVEWFLALRKFGKGRFFDILEKKGRNSSGHRFHPFLTEKLSNVLVSKKDYLWGMQPKSVREMGSEIERFFVQHEIKHEWYWSDVFHRANCAGTLFPMIQMCRNMKMLYVGPVHIKKIHKNIFGKAIAKFIEVPLPDWEGTFQPNLFLPILQVSAISNPLSSLASISTTPYYSILIVYTIMY